MREYDFTIITRGDLPEGEAGKALETYETLITKDGGEILKKEDWGNRKLAFPINKVFRGNYVNYDFVTDPVNVAEMERLMRIDDKVLRYLVVRIDEEEGHIDVTNRKAEIIKADKEAREREAQADARRELRRREEGRDRD